MSAVAAAAEAASRAVAGRIEDKKGDDDEPNDLIVKKIAKTVHFNFAPAVTGAVLSFDNRALDALISFYAQTSKRLLHFVFVRSE